MARNAEVGQPLAGFPNPSRRLYACGLLAVSEVCKPGPHRASSREEYNPSQRGQSPCYNQAMQIKSAYVIVYMGIAFGVALCCGLIGTLVYLFR